MAGAGARTRKDGSASARVGSVEVLKPRAIGPTVPMRRQVQAMATGAASAERYARTPEKRAAAASLRERAESAGRARAAFLAARKGEKGAAATAAHEEGARAMRAGAAAQFAKPKAAPAPAVAKAPRKPVEAQSRRAVRDRNDRVATKIHNAREAHFNADPTHQKLAAANAKAMNHAYKNFSDYNTQIAAKAKADAASDKLYAHKDKLRAEWDAAHPKEARLAMLAGAGGRRAMMNERRQGNAGIQRYNRKMAEIDKAEAPARAKAAAEAAVKAKAAEAQTAKDVAFLKARGARHGIKFEHKDGVFEIEGKYGATATRRTSTEAKAAMRDAIRRKVGDVRNKRERAARADSAQREMDAGVAKARAARAAAPAAPKGYANIHAIHAHGAEASVRPVKVLAQAGDVVAHRPIGEHRTRGGEGYSITHGPTGLRIMRAGSAAEAKAIVAGLGTPHWSKMLEKTVAHDNEAARLTGEHVKRLAAEHASGGAPKVAVSSPVQSKAPHPGTIPITGKTAERIAKAEREARLSPIRTEDMRAHRQARAATGRAYRREEHEARIARATKQRAARDAAKTRTPMKPTTLEGVRDSVLRSHMAGNIAAAERKNKAYERRERAQDFSRQAAR